MESSESTNACSTSTFTSTVSPTTGIPQVRSRITVVCAECKRLKLKCDRRNPCGSCTKRDTIARCIYSPAAAEKVDLHSLNNRLMQVEAMLVQITSGQFTSTYPLAKPPKGPSDPPTSSTPACAVSPLPQHLSHPVLTSSWHDMKSIWLNELQLDVNIPTPASSDNAYPATPTSVKTEPPLQISLSSLDSEMEDRTKQAINTTAPLLSLPANRKTQLQLPLVDIYYSRPSDKPSVTDALLNLLPPSASSPSGNYVSSSYTLQNLLHLAEQSTTHTHPSLNWNNFRSRAMNMICPSGNSRPSSEQVGKRALAHQIFFNRGANSSHSSDGDIDMEHNSNPQDCTKPDLPFYAAICAALALGAVELEVQETSAARTDLMTTGNATSDDDKKAKVRRPAISRQLSGSKDIYDADFWYALSVQALGVFENSIRDPKPHKEDPEEYTMEYLSACILQVIFLLRGGGQHMTNESSTVGSVVFPLVGKMVNIARLIGLHRDPTDPISEHSKSNGIHEGEQNTSKSPSNTIMSLFDIEMRRRMWWDVMYYDVFVSDSMGHCPLIADNSYSTRIPVGDVDEKNFTPFSTRVPLPKGVYENSPVYSKGGFKYFEVRSSFTQLVRNIIKRMRTPELNFQHSRRFGGMHSPDGCVYSIDQAASMETEIRSWLQDLPLYFKADTLNTDPAAEPVLIAQRCELAITAHRLIFAVYLPFMRRSESMESLDIVPHQATYGILNAVHAIINACASLNTVWRRHGRLSTLSSSLFDLYPLGRTLFDAALICAHSFITQPSNIWGAPARDDVEEARSILEERHVWLGLGGFKEQFPGQESLLKVMQAVQFQLSERSDTLHANNMVKRKHDQVDDQDSPISEEFHAVATEEINLEPQKTNATILQWQKQLSPTSPRPPPRKSMAFIQDSSAKKSEHSRHKDKDKNRYPSVGIRVRPSGGKTVSPLSKSSTITTSDMNTDTATSLSVHDVIAGPPASSIMHKDTTFSSFSPPQSIPSSASQDPAFRSRSSSLSQNIHQPPPPSAHNYVTDSYTDSSPLQPRRFSVDHSVAASTPPDSYGSGPPSQYGEYTPSPSVEPYKADISYQAYTASNVAMSSGDSSYINNGTGYMENSTSVPTSASSQGYGQPVAPLYYGPATTNYDTYNSSQYADSTNHSHESAPSPPRTAMYDQGSPVPVVYNDMKRAAIHQPTQAMQYQPDPRRNSWIQDGYWQPQQHQYYDAHPT